MAWDLALDADSGDVIFGPSRDLLGTTGSGLVEQRIIVRCKIRRGSFVYDENNTLGSRLHEITRFDSGRQLREAPALVQEALEPMGDIRVLGVDAEITEDNRLSLGVRFQPIVGTDEGSIPTEVIPEYDARVTY